MRFQSRLTILATVATLPGIVATLILLNVAGISVPVQIGILIFVLGATILLLAILRDRILFSLRTMSNLVGALREGDFSMRARHESETDALGELAAEINRLSVAMREARHDEIESDALVRAIIAQLDAAIFAFDPEGRMQLVNRAGEQMLERNEIDVASLLDSDAGTIEWAGSKWAVRHSTFYAKGKEHRLLVVADVSRALRDEELLAWQRLVRVIGHELNNSLAPIKAVAGGLQSIFRRDPLPADWRADVDEGLSIIANRAEALTRFTQGYARLARLPRPVRAPVSISSIVERVASLSFAVKVNIVPAEDAVVFCDADQIEQALINLIQNAVDASLETGGSVTVTWSGLQLIVRDTGPGLTPSANLFVPFFTTKPGGTGIGLVLARQIAEAHGGRLTLHQREDTTGCEARFMLK